MLQHKAVAPKTLELLKKLMALPELYDFFLVGGTALALQIGHRISLDIDLFTQKDFNTHTLISVLRRIFYISDIKDDVNTLNLNISFPKSSEKKLK